ncbi:SigE family RNA polymerase sigma factor [Micromonospora sp. NPDC007208]|uniref:SigE family RNA polymerase sigma factor n=1 Tax=Micromonospora sp. NPDC007208 TaxID=3364236 RepID=UPI0036C4EE90
MKQIDETEFAEFVVARMDSLRGLAYLTCGNWQTAEDAVSTALSKLYVRWTKTTNPYAYASRIVIHAVIDETRRPWRRERVASHVLPDLPVPDRADSVDEKLRVRAALMQVPRGQRAVLVLRYYEELSVQETAEILGRSTGTVKSQTARGLSALRAALAAQDKHGAKQKVSVR